MTKVYNYDKQHNVNGLWYNIWTREENGYVTKLMFCEHIRELDNEPGFIISVYDRLEMKVVKVTCIAEEDMLRSAVLPVSIKREAENEPVSIKLEISDNA